MRKLAGICCTWCWWLLVAVLLADRPHTVDVVPCAGDFMSGPAASAQQRPMKLVYALEAALERCRRSNKPLLVSRLPGGSDASQHPGWMLADPALLAALAPQVSLSTLPD